MTIQHQARKRFGQNFLHDPGAIQRIVDAVAPRPGQRLVEIGPGQGAITSGLLEMACALDVIELDRDLIGPLRERFNGTDLRIHSGDALRFELCTLLRRPLTAAPGAQDCSDQQPPESARLRLVGNLPYNISTPLLFRFLEQADCIQDMHLMLQKEVVDRMTAEPGSKVYGRLSVMVQSYCLARRLFVVSPGAFRPAPKVSSAVARLQPHRLLPYPVDDQHWHARVVAAAFAQRRKTLRNSLAGLISVQQMTDLGIDSGARAENLSIADFAALANAPSACIAQQIP